MKGEGNEDEFFAVLRWTDAGYAIYKTPGGQLVGYQCAESIASGPVHLDSTSPTPTSTSLAGDLVCLIWLPRTLSSWLQPHWHASGDRLTLRARFNIPLSEDDTVGYNPREKESRSKRMSRKFRLLRVGSNDKKFYTVCTI